MTRRKEVTMPWETSYLPDLDAVLTVYGGVMPAESLQEAVEATVELGRRHWSTRFLAGTATAWRVATLSSTCTAWLI